jgi:sterol desaturase/sphingolipid hydroxylase (fatty acid hydroxylase superfamily)
MKKMLEQATTIRLMSFAMIFIMVALWEIRTPRRRLKTSKKARWIANLSIIIINPVLVRLVFPLLAVEAAQFAQVWDRLFGTYNDQPEKGHTDMVIGLAQFRDPQKLSLWHILILPFVGDPGRVPINRH